MTDHTHGYRCTETPRVDAAGVGGGPMVGSVSAWAVAVESWSVALRAAGRARTTVALRVDHVSRAGRYLGGDPWAVTRAELEGYLGSRVWARETRRSVRASLVGFYRWGVEAGHVLASPAAGLPRIAAAPAVPRPAPESAYRAALAAGDPRERLILRLAAEVGLRRAEIAGIHSRDVCADLVGVSLVVHGKGGRDRVVPLPAGVAVALEARGAGWVFPGSDEGHLSPRWVGRLGGRLLPEGWTLHTLRHRFATRAYALERDLLAVQSLLGHASPVTTRRYVQLEDDRLRATVAGVAALTA